MDDLVHVRYRPGLRQCRSGDRSARVVQGGDIGAHGGDIVNYATWNNPFTMFEIMGFGKASAAESLLLSPGSTALAWGPVLELVAGALDVARGGRPLDRGRPE